MCLYPTDKAYETAFFTSPGGDCQVPNPRAGISTPVLSLKRTSAMSCGSKGSLNRECEVVGEEKKGGSKEM
jgi:hypothetical protein